MGPYRGRENDYAIIFTVRIVCERTWNAIKLVEGRVFSEVFEAHLSKRLSLALTKYRRSVSVR